MVDPNSPDLPWNNVRKGPYTFTVADGVLTRVEGPRGGAVEVPDGVQSVGVQAFLRHDARSVSLPRSVRSIRRYAFAYCDMMERLDLPESLVTIDEGALLKCRALREIRLPVQLESLGRSAFEYCLSLERLELPGKLRTIADLTFAGCRELREIRIPDSVRSIGKRAFEDCAALSEIRLPNGLTSIAAEAFKGCRSLRVIEIPDSVTEIGADAFEQCGCEVRIRRWLPSLERALGWGFRGRIRVGETPEALPEAFRVAALRGFAAEESSGDPARTRSYHRYARRHARELVETVFAHPELLRLFCTRDLIPPGTLDDYLEEAERRGITEEKAMLLGSFGRIGPERVARARECRQEVEERSAGEHAARLALPGTGADIAGLHFLLAGEPFLHDSVPEMREWLRRHGAVVDETVTRHTDFLAILDPFREPDEEELPVMREAKRAGTAVLGYTAFTDLTGRRFPREIEGHFTLPAWLKEIRNSAFRERGIQTVTIPDGVEVIGEYAFESCKALTGVALPGKLVSIGSYAFRGCVSLREVSFPQMPVSIGADAFRGCVQLREIILPEELAAIGKGAFRDCCRLTGIRIPAGIGKIEAHTFRGCRNLRKIDLPEGLTAIGRKAFYCCRNLRELTLPESLRELGYNAFADCKKLRVLRLPAGVSWTENPFGDCARLTLRAPAGSFAESWAREHGVHFSRL